MDDKRDRLISWLKDAYGMESSQMQMLDRFINDFKDDATIKSQLEQHKQVTESQRDRLGQCLQKFGESPSKMKQVTGSIMGAMQGTSTSMSGDEKIKDLLMMYAGENLEYASYLSIKNAAEELGEDDVRRVAEEIAQEEKSTADWAEQQIPAITKQELAVA